MVGGWVLTMVEDWDSQLGLQLDELMVCGSVFVCLFPMTFDTILGNLVWGPTIAIAMGFGYLIYKRIKYRPIQVGPHECRRCRRIIYGTNCPYCESASVFDSHEFKLADAEESERPRVPR